MANSLGNITVSKNRVVAVNIAREGLEAMRNLRDTNWLRYSGNRRECWNHMPGAFLLDSCEDDTDSIQPGNYILYKDETQQWRLRLHEVAAPFDSSQLYLMDIDAAQDTNGDNDPDNDEDIYNHRLTSDNSPLAEGENPLGYENSKITLFKRRMTIDYLTNAGDSIVAGGIPLDSTHNRMVVTSRITWPVGDRELEVELRTHLTDYLGREDLDN